MTTTPRLGITDLTSGQAVPETSVNQMLRTAEQGAGAFIIKDKDLATPPGSPADGDAYIVASTPTGAWVGHTGQIAFYLSAAWVFITAIEGTLAYAQDENARYLYNGAAWGLDGTGGLVAATTTEQLTGTSATVASTPDSVAALWEQGANIASAGTIAIGEGGYFHVTGTTAITDIDPTTDKAGRAFRLVFDGILTLTNGASLILPTGANITTAAGDAATFISEGSDVVRCVSYTRASGAALTASSYTGGKQTIPLLASALTARTTSGAAAGTSESTTNKVMRKTLDFDASAAEYAQIILPMPKSWDESTVTAQFIWEAPGGTGNVVWAIQCLCLSDDDVIDTAFGTAITVTDGVTATTDIMISAETSAVTASNTPAEGDQLVVQVYRDAANGSDTLASDAKLIAVKLFITTNAATDA